MSESKKPTYFWSENNYLNYEIDSQNRFIVDFKGFQSSNINFKWHCIQAARRICAVYPNPFLAVSGGVDSQAMLLSFVESRQDFQIVFFKYTDQNNNKFFNESDYYSLLNFIRVQKINKSINIINIDLDSFYQSTLYLELAKKYECSSPQLLVHIHALSRLNSPFVLAWNLPNIYRYKKRICIHVPDFKLFSYQRFLKKENRPGIPYFFIYSPEQFYTSLMIAEIKELFFIDLPINFSVSYLAKVQCYRSAGFDVIAQDKKRTGFEEYKVHHQNRAGSPFAHQFELDFRQPLEILYPNTYQVCIKMDSQFFKNHILK